MMDFLRNRGTTAEEKIQDALNAYLDNSLTPVERERLEARLTRDEALRAELEGLRALKAQMRAMPRRRVPRSFALDPALYGRPKAQPLMQIYPVLRGATALTAFLLIFTLAFGAFRGVSMGGADGQVFSEIADVAQTDALATAPVAEESAELAAPSAANPEDRIQATSVARETSELETAEMEAAELTAAEELTATFSMDAYPPAMGGGLETTAAPEGELLADATESVVEAPQEEQADTPFDVTEIEEQGPDTAAEKTRGDLSSVLRPLQIGLGALFLVLFVLWVVARRRVRSF